MQPPALYVYGGKDTLITPRFAKKVSLSLPSGATLSHVYSALGATLPMLLGRVISPEGRRLSPGYACNLNGLDFVRTATATINSGDTIFILSADAGG